MKLSPFMKEHKSNLKKLSKKQLINQLLLMTEYTAQASQSHDMEVAGLERIVDDLLDKRDQVREARESMRDAVVDQPSFLDLYKGVSPHTK